LKAHPDALDYVSKTQHPVDPEAWTVGHVGPTYKFLQDLSNCCHTSIFGVDNLL